MQQEDGILLRKKLLKQVKNQVLLQTGQLTKDLLSYSKVYDSEFRGKWKISSQAVLLNRMMDSRLVLGGEFHAFPQSQRTHLRLLRNLTPQKQVIIAVECIESRHQKHLDAFISGEISEKKFLKLVQWDEHWGFPWSNYKPIFDLAKKQKCQIIAINKYYSLRNSQNLNNRDQYSAKKIIQLVKKNKQALVYVIFGEWHLAQNHLPNELFKLMPTLKNDTIKVLQNSEKLYFKLALEGKESHVNVVEYGNNRFCIIGSPPWVQWQSYLMYLEQSSNDQSLYDEEDDCFEIDYTDNLHGQLKFIADDLGLKLKFDDLEVYSSSNSDVWSVFKRKMSRKLFEQSEFYMKNDLSFYYPEKKVFYLSRPTINHLSGLAGLYLQARLSQRTKTPWSMPNDFLKNIWLEALAFFSSKLVNHHRKSDTLEKLKAELATIHPSDQGRDVLLLALDQRLTEILKLHGQTKIKRKFNPKNKAIYFEASKILGSMLGEKLFITYRAKKANKKDVIAWFKLDINSKKFEPTYYKILRNVENVNFLSTFEGVMYGS